MRKFALAITALTLCTLGGSASAASESLSARAVTALGLAIATQGDAALVKIRRELQESALDAMKPFLPTAEKAPAQAQPTDTPAAQQ